jgi:hypothetical protein
MQENRENKNHFPLMEVQNNNIENVADSCPLAPAYAGLNIKT